MLGSWLRWPGRMITFWHRGKARRSVGCPSTAVVHAVDLVGVLRTSLRVANRIVTFET